MVGVKEWYNGKISELEVRRFWFQFPACKKNLNNDYLLGTLLKPSLFFPEMLSYAFFK
jgi:hypothetical protein